MCKLDTKEIGYTHINHNTNIESTYDMNNQLISKGSKMNKQEFDRKLAAYKRSEAPVDVKEKAISELESEFYGTDGRNTKLLKQIEEGYADTSDMGGY